MLTNKSPNMDITNFNNIGNSFLTIFVALTMEAPPNRNPKPMLTPNRNPNRNPNPLVYKGWVDVMYYIEDSYVYSTSVFYFVILILFGSLFSLNLALAVVSEQYNKEWTASQKLVEQQAATMQRMAIKQTMLRQQSGVLTR